MNEATLMKIKTANFLLIFLLTPFLVQCFASKQEMRSIDLRMRTLDNRLVNMDKELNGLHTVSVESANIRSVEFMQKKQAELSNTVDILQAELLQVKGKLDESTHRYRDVKAENKQLQELFGNQFNEMSERIILLEKKLKNTSDDLEKQKRDREVNAAKQAMAMAKAAADNAAQAAREAADKAALAAKEASDKAARLSAEKREKEKTKQPREIAPDQVKKKHVDGKEESGSTPLKQAGKEVYDKAISLFKDKDFKAAYNTFTEYVNSYPRGDLVANARFWLGDCLYNMDEYELAILEYQKVIADYADHQKAPAALLKQGNAFEKLNDKETAKIVYTKLLDDYPKSDQVSQASKRLDALKK